MTKWVHEDAEYLYLKAETQGFSPFAITGNTISGPGGEGSIGEPTLTADKTPTPTDDEGIPGFSLFAGLSILLITVQLLRKRS